MIYTLFLIGFILVSCNGDEEIATCSLNEPRSKCNFRIAEVKKTINPYKQKLANYVPTKPFSSLYFRCSMCLAISEEMNRIFSKINSQVTDDMRLSDFLPTLEEHIDFLCSHGFENYDLRKFQHYQLISNQFKCSSHVRTNADGKWTEKLREMCSVYFHHMDFHYLLNEYNRNQKYNLENYLCRNIGIFGDCFSLDSFPDDKLRDTFKCE